MTAKVSISQTIEMTSEQWDTYQRKAGATAIYRHSRFLIAGMGLKNVDYSQLGLVSEIGEFVDPLLKTMRRGNDIDLKTKSKLIDEAGDVFWSLATLLCDLDIRMGFHMESAYALPYNLHKETNLPLHYNEPIPVLIKLGYVLAEYACCQMYIATTRTFLEMLHILEINIPSTLDSNLEKLGIRRYNEDL